MPVSAPERPTASVLHRRPPTSPSRVLSTRWWVTPLLLTIMVLLALAAATDHARLLLRADLPIEKWVLSHRSGNLDNVFRHISFFGSTYVVLIGGAILSGLALPKCRLVAAYVAVATLARPPVEFVLKLAVDRSRPELGQLVHGAGPSFPSGHVLAASVLWFMVPMVVSLYVPSRRVWWVVTGLSVLAVFLIGCSRVYLGVHWPTDVVGGYLGGLLLLAALDRIFHIVHARRGCDFAHESVDIRE